MLKAMIMSSLMLMSAGVLAGGPFHDPTRPLVGAQPAAEARDEAGTPRVSFIASGGQRRLARIDGAWVVEGDYVGDAQVLRITPTRVRLRQGDQILDLPVVATVMNKTPAQGAAAKENQE